MSWEDEDFEVPAAVAPAVAPVVASKGQWDDEDADDNVKESWEEEEEDANGNPKSKSGTAAAAAAAAAPASSSAVPKKKKKSVQTAIAEREEKTRKEAEEKKKLQEKLAAEKKQRDLEGAALDPAAEKARKQKEIEESDLAVAKDLFSVDSPAPAPKAVSESLDTLNPTSRAEFESFAKLLKKKLSALETEIEFPNFFHNLVRDVAVALPSEEIRKLSSTLNVLSNEKLKEEKGPAKKGKKKGPVKKIAGYDEDFVEDAYDEAADYL